MNIHEFQAKGLFKSYGIPIPAGQVADSAEQAMSIGEQLGGEKWMVKAQVHANGRGLLTFSDASHGIRIAENLQELAAIASNMLGNTLITQQPGSDNLKVSQVYVEEALDVERELALSLLVDDRSRNVILLLSKYGGSQIESSHDQNPDAIFKVPVDLADGVDVEQLQTAFDDFDLGPDCEAELRKIISDSVRLLCEKDASLVEINPLAIVAGHLIALDAKIAFDKNALYRQQDIKAMESENQRLESHRQASLDGFNYIPLQGNVAYLAVGAGLSMATLDAIKDCSGEAASFLDLPPDSKVNRVIDALQLVLSNPSTKSLMVNVFGGGIMRCDTVSDAILLINRSDPMKVPLVVRLSGTNAALANRRLKESMPKTIFASNLADAAEFAVQAANQSILEKQSGSEKSWFSKLIASTKQS